jgi:Abnormal spindle-like microcephaly-assoc'd, ASPM-SPD-2-Hydin/HYDIN/CFA65/VesB-like, Ig-like domain
MRIPHPQAGRAALMVAILLATLASAGLPFASPAASAVHAAVPAAVSPGLGAFGFPDWYQDTNGTRLEPCLDVTDANCIILPNPGVFDPALPMDMPDNFPDEFFYSVVDSQALDTPGCGGTRPGRALLRIALEGAFVNGLPAVNEQMVFGRIRVRVTGGLCPNTTYTFAHPFGTLTRTTDDLGGIKPVVGTEDVGCAPVPATGQTCDFALALRSPVLTSFLRWDPAIAPAAPVGYLGDAATLHAITGGTSGNAFSISDAGGEIARTDLFTVMGKEAGPLLAKPVSVDFGGQNVNTTSTPRPVLVTNVGTAPLTVASLTTTPALFAWQDPNACIGRVLALDESCTVTVTFRPAITATDPTGTGLFTGTLAVAHDGIRAPLIVPLTGTGTATGALPGLSPNPVSLDLGSWRIRTQSAPAQRIRVSNTGAAPLEITSALFLDTVQAGDAAQFVKTSDKCTLQVIQAGKSCDILVAVRPLSTGPLEAVLHLASNLVAGPVDVPVRAIGTGGIAAVSTAIDAATGYPEWYQDENGLRLGQCIDPKDPFCIVLADDFFDPALPISGRPDFANFPEEFFYTVADSDVITTPGCPATATTPAIPAGRAFVRSALEAAFGGLVPTDGEQIVFGRVRIVVRGGLCPNTTYTFTHPYGTTLLTTDGAGSVKPAAGTVDVGCFPVAPDTCNFADALSSVVVASFLQWDPAVAPAAPAGYLGDAVTLHRVTGSPTGNNLFRIVGPNRVGGGAATIGSTSLFTVMGKLNGPLVANPTSVAFAPLAAGASSASQPVTLTNEGIASLDVTGLTIGGLNAAEFTTDGGCDAPRTLAPAASCTMNVTFTPADAGGRNAVITVVHTGRNTPVRIPLNGVGQTIDGGPALVVTPPSLTFADLHTGQVSQSMTLTVSNLGGQAPLEVGVPSVDSDQFTVENLCPIAPATVAIDGTCQVRVRFAPTGATSSVRTGTVSIPGNAAGAVRTVSVSGRAFTGAATVAAAIRPEDGFPAWYGDDNGVRVEPCLDPADTSCIVLADASFDPAQPLSFPSNFPGEFFYQVADSELLATPGCGGTLPGTATLRVALEGAFANGTPAAGDQITFARTRVVVTRGLCANTSYTFTTPYGPVGPYLTNAVGGIPANAGTTDINPPIPGDVLDSGLLRWDPSVAPAAPAGYLGDAITLHPVVGSRFLPAGASEPANYFGIDGTSLRTDLFTVSGKLAGPVLHDPAAIDFSNVNELAQSPSRTVTLTNVGPASVTGFAATITGADAADFAVSGGTCGAGPVAQDATCTVLVQFRPGAVATPSAVRSAVLSVAHSGLNTPATVALSGTAVNVATPAVTIAPASVAFGSVNLGTTTAPVAITLTNSGDADLHVTSAVVEGTNATEFAVQNGCPLAVVPGASCTLQATFSPASGGAKTAQVRIVDDAPTSPQSVSLSGSGVAATISLSPTSLDFGAQGAGGSSTKSVKITNTGTANLVISSLAITGSTTFTIASHTCTAAVAPGKNCGVSVRFAPTTTGGPAFSGSLVISSNAAGSPHSVALSGSRK